MITTEKSTQFVTSLPPRQQQKTPKISLPTKETLYIFGVIAGTAFTAISQQAAFTSIPLLGLLLMQRTNQHRLILAQQQQQQKITSVVEQSLSSLATQIQQLETQINQTESSPKNYLTKTHLTPVIAKLHQLQQENRVFKLRELKNLTQQINTLQEQIEDITHHTESLQISQQKIDQKLQKLQQFSSPTKPSHQPKHTPTQPHKTNRIAIFIDGANLYYSATQLGIEIDYAYLLTFLTGKTSAYQAFFYTGIDSTNQHQQEFLLRLQQFGYQIVSKAVIKRADGSRKANLDVELALDLVELANTYDTAIVVSGDGDFIPAIKRVQRLGKRVEVVGCGATTSQKLLELADDYLDLATLTSFRRIA